MMNNFGIIKNNAYICKMEDELQWIKDIDKDPIHKGSEFTVLTSIPIRITEVTDTHVEYEVHIYAVDGLTSIWLTRKVELNTLKKMMYDGNWNPLMPILQ